MAKLQQQLPAAKDTPLNVGVQKSEANIREAENMGEEAATAAQRYKDATVRFSKHGTFFGKANDHPVEKMWS